MTLSPSSPNISAEMEALSEAERAQVGWVTSAPIDRITFIPLRVGKRKIGDAFQHEAPAFRSGFLSVFERVLRSRFGTQLSQSNGHLLDGNDAVMTALETAVKEVDMSQLATRPTPLRVELPEEAETALAELGGAALFLRAEAHYLGGGTRFVRAAVPVLLTAASAAGGMAAAGSIGSPVFVYTVHGPLPTQDTVVAQAFLVHSETRELLWLGQAMLPRHYKDSGAIDEVARRLAEQVPSAFLKKD